MNNAVELETGTEIDGVALSASIDRLERDFQAICRRYNANLVVTLQNISSTEAKAAVELTGTFTEM